MMDSLIKYSARGFIFCVLIGSFSVYGIEPNTPLLPQGQSVTLAREQRHLVPIQNTATDNRVDLIRITATRRVGQGEADLEVVVNNQIARIITVRQAITEHVVVVRGPLRSLELISRSSTDIFISEISCHSLTSLAGHPQGELFLAIPRESVGIFLSREAINIISYIDRQRLGPARRWQPYMNSLLRVFEDSLQTAHRHGDLDMRTLRSLAGALAVMHSEEGRRFIEDLKSEDNTHALGFMLQSIRYELSIRTAAHQSATP